MSIETLSYSGQDEAFAFKNATHRMFLEGHKIKLGALTIGTMTPDQVEKIDAAMLVFETILGMVFPIILDRVEYNNHDDDSIYIIDNKQRSCIIRKENLGKPEYNPEYIVLVNQFHAMCEAIKPGFDQVVWLQPNRLIIDGYELQTTGDAQSELFIFKIGEMCKDILIKEAKIVI